MTAIKFEGYTMPSASLGKLNPLPDIRPVSGLQESVPIDEATVTRQEARYMGWKPVSGVLPYLIQDGYDRKKQPRNWNAAILENEFIRAVFLPELGGRLWSLYDKDAKRELLHVNPVFQPCNLAIRNAWISGGVEWNCGIKGHTPFTVDSLYAERLTLADGTPVLRMYQYERIRRIVYRIEAMLPENSRYLFVRVRLDNTSKDDTAVYWWSNMAVDERDDARIIVPASRAFRWGYGGVMAKVDTPYMTVDLSKLKNSDKTGTMSLDISRTTQIPQAMDFFFDLPDGQRRWIASINEDGYGFAQTSTDTLIGRKLFVWGMGAGGRNWQTFLSRPGSAYVEIQAGLAHTQLEHLPMAGGQTIDWMEAYGPVTADAAAVHGRDWDAAVNAVEESLELGCPRAWVDEMHDRARAELDGQPGEPIQAGAAWAVIQRALLGGDFNGGGLAFPEDSVSPAEQAWLELVKTGQLSCPDALDEPDSYQTGHEWETLLRKAITEGKNNHWYAHYQYGVCLAHAGKLTESEAAFRASLEREKNPWALRCLAVLYQLKGKTSEAADLLEQAAALLPERNIVKEAMRALNDAKRPEAAINIYNALSAETQAVGRLKVLLIEALLDVNDIDRAEKMLADDIELTDIREGEVMLTDLWFRMTAMKSAEGGEVTDEHLLRVKKEYIPPRHLDFRMK